MVLQRIEILLHVCEEDWVLEMSIDHIFHNFVIKADVQAGIEKTNTISIST